MTQDFAKSSRVKLYEEYFDKVMHNPKLSKSELCRSFGFIEGTIDHIQNEYGLLSPYRFKEQKAGGLKLAPEQKLNKLVKTQETKIKNLKLQEIREELNNPSLTSQQRESILNKLKIEDTGSQKSNKDIKAGRILTNRKGVRFASTVPISGEQAKVDLSHALNK